MLTRNKSVSSLLAINRIPYTFQGSHFCHYCHLCRVQWAPCTMYVILWFITWLYVPLFQFANLRNVQCSYNKIPLQFSGFSFLLLLLLLRYRQKCSFFFAIDSNDFVNLLNFQDIVCERAKVCWIHKKTKIRFSWKKSHLCINIVKLQPASVLVGFRAKENFMVLFFFFGKSRKRTKTLARSERISKILYSLLPKKKNKKINKIKTNIFYLPLNEHKPNLVPALSFGIPA